MLGLGLSIPQIAVRGGASTFNFFVDSASGSDSNDGTTEETAFATLSKAETEALANGDGTRVGLKYGSEWREELDLSSLSNVTVGAYGTVADGLPVVRGDDVVAGPWDTSTDRADSNTNVYSQTFAWEGHAEFWHAVWEDDTRLSWAADAATCDATPGSFFITGGGTQGAENSPQTLYIHPFDSTNANSDGKTREATARPKGVYVGNSSTIERVWGRRCGHNLGHLVAGRSSVIADCLADGGVRHQINIKSGTQRRNVAWLDHDDSRGGQIALEFVDTDGTGRTALWDRCIVVSTVGAGVLGGLGGHTNGVDFYDSWEMRDCALKNATIGCNDSDVLTITRAYFKNAGFDVNVPVVTVTDPWLEFDATAYDSSRLFSFNVVTTAIVEGLRAYIVSEPWPLDGLINTTGNAQDLILRRSIIVDDGGDLRRRPIYGGNTGDITIDRVIMDTSRANSAAGKEFRIRFNNGGDRLTSNNTYFPATANFIGANIVGGATYNDAQSYLDGVQPGGEESGSVIADPSLTDPANGDFTVGGTGLSSGVGLENDPTCQNYTPIPASLSAAETWILGL